MYYGAIKKNDIADGPGVRVSLFVSGCRHHCKGCFQPQTWDFCFGRPYTKETQKELLDAMAPFYVKGLTVLGGEPFEPENQRDLYPFLRLFRERYPGKSLWIFSGYTLEEMLRPGAHANTEVTEKLLGLADVLVDGRFILAEKDLTLRFRGSRNQRILDLPATLAEGTPVLWDDGHSRRMQKE